MNTALAFDLPPVLEATAPIEASGRLARDDVRLMVAERSTGALAHAYFRDLPQFLTAGDVLVVNTSATLPAAIGATRRSEPIRLHLSSPAPDRPGEWVIELRSSDGGRPFRHARAGDALQLDGGATVELIAPYLGDRLWLARSDVPLLAHLARHGGPIRYGYVKQQYPLETYQTAFATTPGSAEMPSAARPFTPELIARLTDQDVLFAPITLHCGVSSPELHEPPYPERFAVPRETAELINAAHSWGKRVIAVGTTAVRAVESTTADDGTVHAGHGWTDLVVTPERGLHAFDGLITGWHEPQASHLLLLEAAAGDDLLHASYDAALADGYRWHEFGDSHLILP